MNVVPLALARLERLIQVRLAESLDLGEADPAITVKVYDAAEGAPNAPSIPDDPQFYDAVVDKIVSTLDRYLDSTTGERPLTASALNEELENVFAKQRVEPHMCDFFVGHLRCLDCGAVTADASSACETFLRSEPHGEHIRIGSEFSFDATRVASDYYAYSMTPPPGEPVHVVEGWECPECDAVNWAEIVLREDVVCSIWSVALTREVLQRAHYLTSECVELAAQLTGRPAWSLLGDDVFEILFDQL